MLLYLGSIEATTSLTQGDSVVKGLDVSGKSTVELAFYLAVIEAKLTEEQLRIIERDFSDRFTGAFTGTSVLVDLYDNLSVDVNTGGINPQAPSRLIHLLHSWGYGDIAKQAAVELKILKTWQKLVGEMLPGLPENYRSRDQLGSFHEFLQANWKDIAKKMTVSSIHTSSPREVMNLQNSFADQFIMAIAEVAVSYTFSVDNSAVISNPTIPKPKSFVPQDPILYPHVFLRALDAAFIVSIPTTLESLLPLATERAVHRKNLSNIVRKIADELCY